MKDEDVKAMTAVAPPDFDTLLRDLFLHSLDISGDRDGSVADGPARVPPVNLPSPKGASGAEPRAVRPH